MAISSITSISPGITQSVTPDDISAAAQSASAAPATPAAKTIVSQSTTSAVNGEVTIVITYSDGTTSTVTEPGDTISLSLAAQNAIVDDVPASAPAAPDVFTAASKAA